MDHKPLQLTSYNLEEITKQLIMHLMTTNPRLGRKDVADALGVSERTLYRYFKKMDVDIPRKSSDVIVPLEVKQKVRTLAKNFPNMKRAEISVVLMQYYNMGEQTVAKWLNGLRIMD